MNEPAKQLEMVVFTQREMRIRTRVEFTLGFFAGIGFSFITVVLLVVTFKG